jgi:hypothetical protein
VSQQLFVICEAEWDMLFDEPAELFKLYCALRKRMDFETGVVGRRPRISETFIGDCLSVPPIKGRHAAGRPSRQKCRSAMSRLIAIGLLRPIGEKGTFVFELPMAHRSSPCKSSTTDLQPYEQPYEQPRKANKKHKDSRHEQPHEDQWCSAMNNQPQDKGIVSTHYVRTNTAREAGKSFAEFWQAYPAGHRVDKRGCEKKWRARNLDDVADAIVADVEQRKAEDGRWLEGFVPNSTTYLNQTRWESDLAPKRNAAAGSTKQSDAKAKFLEIVKR